LYHDARIHERQVCKEIVYFVRS